MDNHGRKKLIENTNLDYYRKLYFEMWKIRHIEEQISIKYSESEMRCPVHLSIGQEAVSVGVCSFLDKKDKLYTTHRSHGHYIAKGGNVNSMLAEIYGKENGCNGGRGGSMHLSDLSVNFMISNPIIGSSIPLGVGNALSNQIEGINDLSVIIFGDAAIEEGVFHECMNFASLKNLKVLFVCENNQYSIYTHLNERQPLGRSFKDIGKAYDIQTNYIDGSDVLNVKSECDNAKHYIHKNNKPFFLIIDTYRWLQHCGPETDDHLGYRDKKDIKKWIENCSIIKMDLYLQEIDVNWTSYRERTTNTIKLNVQDSFAHALRSNLPNKDQAWENIYVK